MPIGKSIRVYLADSTVTGIRYAELVNWTGQAVACPRNRLSELSLWPEASKPGVYVLFEARLGNSNPLAYIGESEDVADRLTTHDRQKDFWNEVVIFTSKDENLTKAHIKYLESTLVRLAKQADRYELENGNTPPESSLPRADRDAMAEFVENIRMVLGTLGYPILEPILKSIHSATTAHDQVYNPTITPKAEIELIFKINGLTAYGVRTDEGFVVKKGSHLSKTNSASAASRMVKLKEQLRTDGKLTDEESYFILNDDILVSSSSASLT